MPYALKCWTQDGSFYFYVLVDEDVYYRFRNHRIRLNKDGYPSVNITRENGRGGKALLHKLILPGSKGKSVHHMNGKMDCRRQYLKIYDSDIEHLRIEHSWSCTRTKKDKRLSVADLHPHCG